MFHPQSWQRITSKSAIAMSSDGSYTYFIALRPYEMTAILGGIHFDGSNFTNLANSRWFTDE